MTMGCLGLWGIFNAFFPGLLSLAGEVLCQKKNSSKP